MKHAKIYLALLAFSLSAGLAVAQIGNQASMTKLDPSLIALHRRHSSQAAARTPSSLTFDGAPVRLVVDRVVIDAVAEGDAQDLKTELELLGMQEAVVFGRIVSGQLPVSAIPDAAALASLRFARSAAAINHAGLVKSQGDIAQRSDVARNNTGFDGTGVKVGVLSDSYNCRKGAGADVQSGDLSKVTVLQEISGCGRGTDEGRAMLQIVHDVAPGAGLLFASAFNGMASFANNIIKLQKAGAKVIVDSVLYFAEPMFQDGIIAQAVDTVVAGGSAYFSSAGNQARIAYQSAFRNSGTNLGSSGTNQIPSARTFFAHDFDVGPGVDIFQTVTVPNGITAFSFQWADRYFSVSGAPGAETDLDLAVFLRGNVIFVTSSRNVGRDPIEVVVISNPGAPVVVEFAIGKVAGPDPALMKNVAFGANFAFDEHATDSGTIFGHANALGAETVGAAAYDDTPAFGVSPPVLESFSSAGATPILFDLAGNPVHDPRVDKPEIVAPDGVDNTFFGIDTDGTGFPNFFGTSAAAPHAAGVAALLLDRNPKLTPALIYSALESTAVDMSEPGFDNDSGFGLIQADAAIASIPDPAPPETTIDSGPPALSNSATALFAFTSNVAGSSFACAIDGGPFTACKSPKKFTKLANGNHVFEVNATDPDGVMDPSPASFSWTIDTVSPDTAITSGPSPLTSSVDSSFAFTSTEPGSTFQCKLDKAIYMPCASPQMYTGLANGKHTFWVAAIDPAGNPDRKAALYKWAIDATAPETTIKKKPPAVTSNTSATFSFSANQKGSTFVCRLDANPFASCVTPLALANLLAGTHTFEVQATDPAGNVDPTPASYTWTIQ
jgi:hypothetical protein